MSASLSADSAPGDPDDELLVAYLDGELHRSERTEVENRLLSEETLRGRLTQLQSSWDMLGVLSVDGPGASLVETTLELAIADVSSTVSGSNQSQQKGKRSWRSRQATSVLVACVLAAVAASLFAAFQARQDYQGQLRDLAIAQDLDAYNYGGDLELIRMLAADPDWTQIAATATELSLESTVTEPLSQISLAQRTAAIERMSADERGRLGSRWDAFSRLSDANKETIRQLASEIATLPDEKILLETMQFYAVWRSRLPSGLVDQIEGNDASVRRQAISDAIDESKSSIAEQSGSQLDDETVDVIYFALQEFAKKRIPKEQRQYRPPGGFRGSLDSRKAREWFGIRQLFGYTDRRQSSSRERSSRERTSSESDRAGNRNDTSLSPTELATIESLLSVRSQETLDIVTGGDPTLAAMTLQIWVEEVIRRKMPMRSDNSMLERYQKLNDKQREAIDLMTPDQMLQSLSSGRPIWP